VGILWADRFAYCQPGRTLPPEVELAGSYWQEDCVMPLGQMYWVLAVQVRVSTLSSTIMAPCRCCCPWPCEYWFLRSKQQYR
jgi:hypothetical protein